MEHHTTRPLAAALATLIILQLVMLSALYAGIRPHPPETTPLFGIAPFIGVAIAVAASALILGPAGRPGRALAIAAAVLAAVSFGPQKYADPQFAMIWPAVIAGQVAILGILYAAIIAPLRSGRHPSTLADSR